MKLEIGKDAEVRNYQLVNLDTREIIKDVIWADDILGHYCVYTKDKNNNFIRKDLDLKRHMMTGNIRFIRVKQS
jgi:hypothetical protein